MQYFSEDFIEFFKELASNNHKDWFDENRERYANVVREPFKLFVTELIARMHEIDPSITIEAKDAIFRINRDIRFAKDKSPYKINRSAIISPNGRKDKTTPGLYFEFTPEYVRVYGGVYQLATAQVAKVRETIAKDLKGFNQLISEKNFVKTYGEIKGEKVKRLPKELKVKAEKQELLFNKSWYYFTELPSETILSEDLPTIIIDNYLVGKPVSDFFGNVLKG